MAAPVRLPSLSLPDLLPPLLRLSAAMEFQSSCVVVKREKIRMFPAGLKFSLGFVAGLTLFSGIAILAFIGAELFTRWRTKRRQRLWRAILQFRERAIFQYFYRSDD